MNKSTVAAVLLGAAILTAAFAAASQSKDTPAPEQVPASVTTIPSPPVAKVVLPSPTNAPKQNQEPVEEPSETEKPDNDVQVSPNATDPAIADVRPANPAPPINPTPSTNPTN